MSDSGTPTPSRLRWVIAGVAALAVAGVVAAVVAALSGGSPSTPVAGTGTSTAAQAQAPSQSSAVTVPGGGTAVAPTAGSGGGGRGPAGDPNHPGDGTWGVGRTATNNVVASGTYETTVPAGSRGCEYTRIALNHTIIHTWHARAGQHVTVTIESTDGLFNTKGCGQWQRVN
jgi:hypothetical protein